MEANLIIVLFKVARTLNHKGSYLPKTTLTVETQHSYLSFENR